MLSRPYEEFYNSRCSLYPCFFSPLLLWITTFKKQVVFIFFVFDDIMFNVSYLIGRVVVTACKMIYLQSFRKS